MTEKKRYKLVIAEIGDKSFNVFEDIVTGDVTGFGVYYQQGIVDLLNEKEEQIQELETELKFYKHYVEIGEIDYD